MIYRVDNGYFITDNNQWGASIYAYLSQYLDGLSYDTETYKIDFWGIFKIRVTRDGSTTRLYMTTSDGSEVSLGGANDVTTWVNWTFTLVKTDNFLYFRMQHPWNNGGCYELVWANDGANYVGGNATGSIGLTFYDSAIYKMPSTQSPYYPVKLLNFTTVSSKLAFSEIAIAITEGNQSFMLQDLCSCSNISKGSVVTIQGDNYVALDTNTLIMLDPVVEENNG